MRLEGKRAIVTGAASGFGAGIARRFAAEGAAVVVADRNGDGAMMTAAELGETALACAVDVTDDASVAALAAFAAEHVGAVDILVNAVGVTHPPDALEHVSEADFDRLLAVNAKSIHLTARHFVPAMRARGHGAILNVVSGAGVGPRPGLAWYGASRGWTIAATRAMAAELAPDGVRVNAIDPVAAGTPPPGSPPGEDAPEARARLLAAIPLGRLGTPDDVAAAACFLCSDEASLITGVALGIDGGHRP